jgi:hypothetical protein
LKRAAPAVTHVVSHTHKPELTKAIAEHQQDVATVEKIYTEMMEIEQRMKRLKPILQNLEHQKDSTAQIEFRDLSEQLFNLQTHKKRLALRLDQWKRKTEQDDDKVKALRKLVAEERDNGCARYISGERSTSPQAVASGRGTQASPDPGGRRSTSPKAGVRNTARHGISPDSGRRSTLSKASDGPDGERNSFTDPGGRRSTSPKAGVRNTARHGISPDSGRRSTLSKASDGPDGERNSFTDPGGRRSTSPQAGVRNTARRGISPDSGRRSTLSKASDGPDGERNSLTDNKFQSIHSLRDTEIEVDLPHEFRRVKILGGKKTTEIRDGDGAAQWAPEAKYAKVVRD